MNSGSDRLSCYFGLSYASFLTLPRVLMGAMSDEWQNKMADLLEQYDESWDWSQAEDIRARVQATDGGGRLKKMPTWLCNYRRPDFEAIEQLRMKNTSEQRRLE